MRTNRQKEITQTEYQTTHKKEQTNIMNKS